MWALLRSAVDLRPSALQAFWIDLHWHYFRLAPKGDELRSRSPAPQQGERSAPPTTGPWLHAFKSQQQRTYALRGSGRTLHNALDHHGGDAREHGLGLRGPQYGDDRVRPLRLRLRVATAEHIPEL